MVQRGGYHGVYLRSGHLVYVHDGALMALPFDADRLEPIGAPARVLDGLASNAITGGAQFSISDRGTLVYLSGASIGAGTAIDLVDHDGRVTALRRTPANWFTPAFAPDGRRLALAVREGPSEPNDIWVHEAGREALVRITADPGGRCAAGLDARRAPPRVRFGSRRPRAEPVLATHRWIGHGGAVDDERQRAAAGIVASERTIPGVRGDAAGDAARRDDPADAG